MINRRLALASRPAGFATLGNFRLMALWPEALKEPGSPVDSGKMKEGESIASGRERAPEAFLGLLKGRSFGKQLGKLV